MELTHQEIIAWTGAVAFAVCSIPQAYHSWKTKSAKDISALFLSLWTVGELCMIYVYWKEPPLLFNYVFNLLGLIVIWRYKIWN